MMNKLRNNSGMTLIEMMAAILILVFLVVGMGTGMDAGMRVYRDSQFETDSAALADIMNTSLGDLFRYAQDITPRTKLSSTDQAKVPNNVDFVFTNMEFGVLDGYFSIDSGANGSGKIQLKNLRDGATFDLVNGGAYPNLKILDLHVQYVGPKTNSIDIDDEAGITQTIQVGRGGFFYVTYVIESTVDSAKSKTVETVVRQMNAE